MRETQDLRQSFILKVDNHDSETSQNLMFGRIAMTLELISAHFCFFNDKNKSV